MKRTIIEKLIAIAAWLTLIGGILFGALVSKGILESSQDMNVPNAFFTFVCSVFCSVVGWAVLLEIIKISDRLRRIEEQFSEQKDK